MSRLFRLDMFQWARLVQEIVRICLGYKPSLVGFHHVEFVALFLGEGDGVFLSLEL